jgi:hypothetical protein
MKGSVAAAVVAGLLAAAPAGAAAPWQRVADPAGGFSIAVPAAWQVVPPSSTELRALVVRLAGRKQTALANQFAQVAAARRGKPTIYRFQAFAWPAPKGAVVPDVTVKTDPVTAGTTPSALPVIARQIAKALAGSAGATASAPVRRTVPAGHAVSVTGTTQLTKSLRSRFAIYLLIHRGKLYSISFRGPPTPVEGRIVAGFRFS